MPKGSHTRKVTPRGPAPTCPRHPGNAIAKNGMCNTCLALAAMGEKLPNPPGKPLPPQSR